MPAQQHAKGFTLGETLRQAREEHELTTRQLEALSGVPRNTINRLENEAGRPTAEPLRRLARALELNETDLFLLAGLPVPDQAASLDIMLRKGYGISDKELPELRREIEALIASHGGSESRSGGGTGRRKPSNKQPRKEG